MKKLIVISFAALTLAGCYTGKPYTLKPDETIDTIRTERERDEQKTRQEFDRKKRLIQSAWKQEIEAAKKPAREGLISWESYELREFEINKKYNEQLWALKDRVDDRLLAIDNRFDGKYAAWLCRR